MGQGKGEGGSLWWTDSVEVAGVGVGTVVGVEEGCGEGSGSEGHISELCMERSKNKNKYIISLYPWRKIVFSPASDQIHPDLASLSTAVR